MWTVLATQGSLGTALDLTETLEAAYGNTSASVWAVLGAYDWVGTTMFSPKSWHALLVILGFITSVVVAVRLGSAMIFGFRVAYARGGITGMFFYVLGLGQFASVMVGYAHYGIRTAQSVSPSMPPDPDVAPISADIQDFSPHTLVLEQFWRRWHTEEGVELAHTTEAPGERAAPQGCLTAPGEERELSPSRWRDIDDQW